MHQNAKTMSEIAAGTRVILKSVSGAVTETQKNVQSVATSAEGLARAIEALAKQTDSAMEVTNETVLESEGAKSKIQQLVDAVGRMLPITEVIQAIAQQSNPLALNATIEPARAGAAGKGFDVCNRSEVARSTNCGCYGGNGPENFRCKSVL